MTFSIPATQSTAKRLRQEIEALRKLIEEIRSRSGPVQSDRWYLQMLNQSMARKRAALEYIESRENAPNSWPETESRQGRG